jgi:hypothetical protein
MTTSVSIVLGREPTSDPISGVTTLVSALIALSNTSSKRRNPDSGSKPLGARRSPSDASPGLKRARVKSGPEFSFFNDKRRAHGGTSPFVHMVAVLYEY